MVDTKKEIEQLDGTPKKRLFLSIISDYDLKTGLCELADNAIDLWMSENRARPLAVNVEIDVARQLLSVTDDAGGVKRGDLSVLIAPGESNNDLTAAVIGVFGVGGKRAGIALAEQVTIRTRFHEKESCELDITEQWLRSESWWLPAYEIPDIPARTTQVLMSHLRKSLREEDLNSLRAHFGETYSWFLGEGCTININDVPVAPVTFETWAFPRGYEPHRLRFEVSLGKSGTFKIELTGGLIRDRDPETENYGVYFYCNRRLIAKEQRTHEVGYVSGEAGVSHPDASLCRVIVRILGPVQGMPWNSSKNRINYDHRLFDAIRPRLVQLVKYYSSLSRRLKGDWDREVFPYDEGAIAEQSAEDVEARGLVLLDLPRVKRQRAERYKAENEVQLNNQPWTLGLVESIAMIDIIERHHLETKNRISLILLDSTLEIALKEFIVHRQDLFPADKYGDAEIARLFRRRDLVTKEIVDKLPALKPLLDIADHYYQVRNKLIHERATTNPTDADIRIYRQTVERLLSSLFNLQF
jgi:hypothetical protein